MVFPIITKNEAEKIISVKEGTIDISLDLGISLSSVLVKGGFVDINGQKIPLPAFNKLKEETCYIIEDNAIKKLAVFSDETNLYYKLIPAKDWPTITLSSTPMHRHALISPKQDSLLKIEEISPVKGKVLDTCCGLGYTAVLSSKKADEVYSFEIDKNVLFIARLNPHSRELFSSKKIKLYEEDIFSYITNFEDNFFDRIIHDPPTFKYSPELYSSGFYSQLYRVLKRNGILYHYCPCPHKTKGKKFYPRIIRLLKEARFEKIRYNEESSGIRALKL